MTDYSALAAQFGGQPADPDYGALAKVFGGQPVQVKQSPPPRQVNREALNPEVTLPFGLGTIKDESDSGFNPAAAIIKAGSTAAAINAGAGQALLAPGDWLLKKMGLPGDPRLAQIDAQQAAAKQPMQDLQEVHPGSTLIGDMVPAAAAPWRALPALAATQYGSPTERAVNAGVTYLGGKLAQQGGQVASKLFAKSEADAAASAAQNAAKDGLTQAAQQEGLAVSPTQANPTLLNRLLEGYSGKRSTEQALSIKNQPVIDALITRDINATAAKAGLPNAIPPNTPVTPQTLEAVRSRAYTAGYAPIKAQNNLVPDQQFASDIANVGGADYAKMIQEVPEMVNPEIAKISAALSKPEFSGSTAIRLIRQFRSDASANFKNVQDPKAADAARAQLAAADALEGMVERNLSARGQTDAVSKFQVARQLIAKTHDAESALTPGGNFAAADYAKMLDKGRPLTGPQKLVGEFATQYPKNVQSVTTAMPGVSPLDYAAMGGIATALHNPLMMAGVVGRPMARSMLTSKPYQALMTTPKYQPSSILGGLSRTLDNPLAPYGAGLLGYEATR